MLVTKAIVGHSEQALLSRGLHGSHLRRPRSLRVVDPSSLVHSLAFPGM